jgi:hypothetical protein
MIPLGGALFGLHHRPIAGGGRRPDHGGRIGTGKADLGR